MKNYQTILSKMIEPGIQRITLNRPHVKNAFDAQLIKELTEECHRINTDESIRVLLLTGQGDVFSAGADLNWMQSMVAYDQEANYHDSMALAELMHSLYNLKKPTIALINGHAFGGGIGLVCCCDIAIASEQARFCFSEVKLGLIPAVISPYVLKMMGERNARRYFLTAERFTAHHALEMGLINATVNANMLLEDGIKMAQLLMQNSPAAMSACKSLINTVTFHGLSDALIQDTAERIADIRVSPEGQEGLNAFLEKRKPNWIN